MKTLSLCRLLWIAVALLCGSAHAAVTYRASASATASVGGITYVGVGAVDSDGSGSLTPGYPAGWQTNDLLLCIIESRDNAAATMPAGWTALSAANSGTTHRATIFWKLAAAADDTTPTVTHSGNVIIARIIGFRGVNTTTPFDVANSFTASAADLTTEAAAITTVTADTMLVFTAHMADNHTAIAAPTGSTPWTQAFLSATSTGTDASIAAFYGLRSATGSQAALSATRTGAANAISHGAQIALRPATTTLTINKPAATSQNDVMVASISVTPSTGSIATPAGWTLIGSSLAQASGGSVRLNSYYRVAGAAEPASYTWTIGAHTGAAGGISSFSGVDTAAPIDAQGGATTASSLTHATADIAATANGMLVTTHVISSSATWTVPTGMTEAFDVASLAAPNAAGIAMAMHYQERPTAGLVGARSATASANADTGATQAVTLRAATLVCFSDNFNRANGPPGASWIVSNSNGTFGNPVIASNRLRLTNDTGNVATMATLQQLFPGAGNRIEVVFNHYAYGGTGADGIVLVLSNAAVTPVPGGYGGSLGYSPNTSAGAPGFAGGWLGIGIDEFGNFPNPTEGRNGGPGAEPDSVTIRGSSGVANYPFHANSGTLAPGIDGNGSAVPAHKYRIIVDHSNGVNAYVSVERDTGAGYVMLIAPYDAKAQPNQAAVPTDWILSYTGSTGGSDNFHEIDNLEICATSQRAVSAIHHFDIQVAAAASTCTPQQVTIRALDASNNQIADYAGTVNITTSSNHGDWSVQTASGTLVNGTVDDGAATYSFVAADGGDIVLNLTNTHADDLTISVVDNAVGSTLTTTGTVNFRDSAFVITPDSIQIAGRPQATSVSLYTRTSGGCLIDSRYSGAKNLDAWITRDIADPGGAVPTIGALNLPTAAPAVAPGTNNLTLTFVNGTATFNLGTTDVGKYVLNIRDDTRSYANAIDLIGASSAITTRPWLHVTVPGNPAASTAAGTLFTSAGTNFSTTVRGVLWQSGDDGDNNGVPDVTASLADNPLAPSFRWITTLSPIAPFTPATGTLGTLANGSIPAASYSGGAVTVNNVNYSEVGSFTMQAFVDDYLNTPGADLYGSVGPVGRFRPANFNVTYNSPQFGTFCNGFTYVGQDFSYTTAPVMTIIARNAAGATTTNYGQAGGWFKITNTSLTAKAYTALTGTLDLGTLPAVDPVIVNGGAGTATLTFSSGTGIRFVRGAPVAPFNAEISLSINVLDSEGVAFASNPARFGAPTAGNGIDFSTAKLFRYGQLRLFNALGSTQLALPITMRMEYWDGSGFARNQLDHNCTSIPAANVTLGNYQVNLNAGETTLTAGPYAFTNGEATPTLSAPGIANNGSTDVTVNLAAPLTHLRGRWNDGVDGDGDPGTTYDDNPVARASFGLYGTDKTPNRFIYSRENY